VIGGVMHGGALIALADNSGGLCAPKVAQTQAFRLSE
jgi:acyl-coenzyme A thioesterase PaaI-like protein